MQDTGYDLPGTILPKRAAGYEKSGTAIRNADYLDMTVPYAAGSLYSTVLDLVKWDQALAGTQLLSEASKTLLFKPFKHNYAYGWGVGKFVVGSDTLQLLSHDGGINGFGTTITRLPQRQALVVVLDNEGGEQAGRLGGDLLRVLYHKAPKGPEPASPGASTAALASAAAPAVAAASTAPATAAMTSPVAAAENAAALAAYVGRYEVAPTFSITVKEQSGQLTAQATGQQPFGLVAMAPGRFRVPVLAAEVEFVRNAAGKVEKLVLHQDGHHSPGRKVE